MSGWYMLDADIVSYWFRHVGQVRFRVMEHPLSRLCVSAVTVAQLRYGATLVQSAPLRARIDGLTESFAVLPFDEQCAAHYAVIAADLTKRGERIGEFDTLIAAHAIAVDATLVTNNVRHFERIRRLRVENWT